jgi:hypothetical protein
MSVLEVVAIVVGVLVLLAGGAYLAYRGGPSTEPGLPPVDQDPLISNPPPLGSFIDPD